ncbi:MAG: hypothetical protein HQL28_03500 [Candidatus Omnitrophica bacterium]|nr:hypothetical protein [Candidatus Omnitrophota bacterium]
MAVVPCGHYNINVKHILLVNPWIYDFAAYDLWMKPWGLLKLSAILKKHGFRVSYVDCMDRHHPLGAFSFDDHPDGTGKFFSSDVEKPEKLKHVPRNYRRMAFL